MRATTMKTGAALMLAAMVAAPAGAQMGHGAVDASLQQARAAMVEARASMVGLGGSMAGVGASMAAARYGLEAAQASLGGLSAMGGMGYRVGQTSLAGRAPEPWLQEDPAAKAYAAAREALNNRRYPAAAAAFAKLREDYPRSGYVPDSYYWQAFALYRRGGTNNVRAAMELLDAQQSRHPDAGTKADADELRVRLEAQLARQGDARSYENITRQATQPCDGDEQETRAAALSALLNMNADQAIPILKRVLEQRDECSADLRRQAVFLISQKMTDESVDILLDLAHRNPDPDPEVREQAVFWLSQVKSPEALQALESILRESTDQDVQEKAIFAISQHGSDEAVRVLREYAERADAPKGLRENAIFWIGQNPKAGGTQYLMDLYPRLSDPELKEKAIFAIAQGNNAASRRWLLERARDRSESVDVRKNALFWAGQTGGLTAVELKELYGTLSDPEMKEQVIFVASQKNQPEAVDFLMDVAKNEQDKELKKRAIFWLGQSKDPRATEFLLSLIGG
jgi:HEAT repeat protein